MKELRGVSYNILHGYPSGKVLQTQAELVLHISDIVYQAKTESPTEFLKMEKIKSIRFVTHAAQMRELAKDFMHIADTLDKMQSELCPSEDTPSV